MRLELRSGVVNGTVLGRNIAVMERKAGEYVTLGPSTPEGEWPRVTLRVGDVWEFGGAWRVVEIPERPQIEAPGGAAPPPGSGGQSVAAVLEKVDGAEAALLTVERFLAKRIEEPGAVAENWKATPYDDAWLVRPERNSRGGSLYLVQEGVVMPVHLASTTLEQVHLKLVQRCKEREFDNVTEYLVERLERELDGDTRHAVSILRHGGEWREAVENLVLGLEKRATQVAGWELERLTRICARLGLRPPELLSS